MIWRDGDEMLIYERERERDGYIRYRYVNI